jgi:short-subunit dehydrogenase
MTSVRGAAAALTGAASGIGRALALELAELNCELALGDRDEAGLLAVAAEIAKIGPRRVTTHLVDVSKPDQIQDFAQKAISSHPDLNILINNAGVALIGEFEEIDQAQMDWLMDVNFWGVVHATRAFLPHLARQREAHIVNVSSIFGIIAPPGQTAYAAAKFAVRGFSESLRHELETAGSPIKLSLVHPGGVVTNIARNACSGAALADDSSRAEALKRFDSAARTTPEEAAKRIIEGVEHNHPRILIGFDAQFVDNLQRLQPETYWKQIANIFSERKTANSREKLGRRERG